jgi:hypothetical protein
MSGFSSVAETESQQSNLSAFLVVPVATMVVFGLLLINMALNPEIFHGQKPLVEPKYYGYVLALTTGLFLLYALWRLVGNIRRIIVLGTGAVAVDALGAKNFIAAENKRVRSARSDNFFAGKAVLRIGDAHWEGAVKSAIENVDFIIFDATQFAIVPLDPRTSRGSSSMNKR